MPPGVLHVSGNRNGLPGPETPASPGFPRGRQMPRLISPALIPQHALCRGDYSWGPRAGEEGTAVRETGQHHLTQDALGWLAKECCLHKECPASPT